MGLDATFHAISEEELNKYVFDVLKDPSKVSTASKEITSDEQKSDRIENAIYRDSLIHWFNSGTDSDGFEINGDNFSNTISFAIAILSGYLHPYWYSRNGAITLARGDHPDVAELFTSFADLENSPLSKYNAKQVKFLNGNYSASGIIKNVDALKQWVSDNDDYLSSRFESDGYDSLNRAIDYCLENDLYFIEAAEVVIPFSDQCFSDLDNFKAHFLKNI
jgi:hypothetical protein